MNKFIVRCVEDMAGVVPGILEAIGGSRVVAMDGPMGAGKTTLVKAICEYLGVKGVVNSPTFAIINDYELADGGAVYHFDLYRLKDVSEAFGMGFEEYFYSGCYCFVEWPGVAEGILPDDAKVLRIRVLEDGVREIEVE